MARSIKKGPFIEASLLKRVEAANNAGQKQMIKTYSRSSTITPDMVGFTISVYNGKTYTFAMNGQTGKFVGELPVDRLKYWLWTGGIAAAVTLIGAISAFLM